MINHRYSHYRRNQKPTRTVLGVNVETIASTSGTMSGVSVSSAKIRAENGFAVKYSTAVEIVEAFNNILATQKKPPITMVDLDINLE